MATITVSVGALSDNKTISSADVTRVLAAGRVRWGAGLSDAQVFTNVAALLYAAIIDLGRTSETQVARVGLGPDIVIS